LLSKISKEAVKLKFKPTLHKQQMASPQQVSRCIGPIKKDRETFANDRTCSKIEGQT
jgi:hypothetical protein